MRKMTVSEFRARLDGYEDDALCCGTFWLAGDFLQINPALTHEQVAAAMGVAEKHHDAELGFNWSHLTWAVEEITGG